MNAKSKIKPSHLTLIIMFYLISMIYESKLYIKLLANPSTSVATAG